MIDNNYILFWKVYLTLETKLKDFHWKIYAFDHVKDINNYYTGFFPFKVFSFP